MGVHENSHNDDDLYLSNIFQWVMFAGGIPETC